MRGTELIADLYEIVWCRGDLDAIASLVAPAYTIHSDPGDAWERRTLNRAEYRQRVLYSRTAFPDLLFTVHELVAEPARVVARWSARGTHAGDLDGIPATHAKLSFTGMTLYEIGGSQVAGHWQCIDRVGFLQQIQALRPPANGLGG